MTNCETIVAATRASQFVGVKPSWRVGAAALVAVALAAISCAASFIDRSEPDSSDTILSVYVAHALYWATWTIIVIVAYRVAHAATTRSWGSGLLLYAGFASAAAAALAGYYLAARLFSLLGAPQWSRTHALWYASSNLTLLAMVCLGTAFAQNYNLRRAREVERRSASLENRRLAAALANSRLAALRSQIHPHLIFNTLNCVAALIHARQVEDASCAVARLGDLLRMTLAATDRSTFTLREEFALIEVMFEISTLRFGNRFAWTIDLPPELNKRLVPPFLVQPLAENAMLHAVGRTSARVDVHVRAYEQRGTLVLEVEDTGSDARPSRIDYGFGLRNLHERITLLRGNLTVVANSDGGVAARIDLPVSEAVS